jgi:hypothetical protein
MSRIDPAMVQEFTTEVVEHVNASEQVLIRAGTEELSANDINPTFAPGGHFRLFSP